MNHYPSDISHRWLIIIVAICTGSLIFLWGGDGIALSDTRTNPSANLVEDTNEQILIKFAEGATQLDKDAIGAAHGLTFVHEIAGLSIGVYAAIQYHSTERDAMARNVQTYDTMMAALTADPLIDYVEPDYEYQMYLPPTQASIIPNDPLFNQQWGLVQINAPTAWNTTTGSNDVVIAIVDTGVDLTHPDLASQLVPGRDFVRNSSNPDDWAGHGTHVASIAASAGNNGEGVAGTAWGARIMPIRVLNSRGSGRTSDIAEGVVWAVGNGADIINLSLGGSSASSTLRDAVRHADDRDVFVVAAMGNEFESGSPTSYPAAYAEAFAVGAIDQSVGHAFFSSSGNYIDVAAPGVNILAAAWRETGSSYVAYSGTSMATPFVAGVAALLRSIDPSLSNAQLRTILTETAADVESSGWDTLTGHGVIDAAEALARLPQGESSTATPTATPTTIPTATPTATPLLTATPTTTPVSGPPVADDNTIQMYLPIIVHES